MDHQSKESKTQLIVDQRESIKLSFSHLNPQFRNLELGDYLIILDDKEVFIIERKTISDWMASIKDGRYHEQKIRLLAKYQKTQILFILEGEMYNDFTLYSSVINTMFRDEFRVFHTSSERDTIILIENILKKFEKQKEEWIQPKEISYTSVLVDQIVPKKSDNQTTDRIFSAMLSCIPGVSKLTANELVKIFPNMGVLCEKINSFSDREDMKKWITTLEIKTSTGKTKKLGKVGLKISQYIISL